MPTAVMHPALYPPYHIPTPPYRIGGYAATAAGLVGTPPSAAGLLDAPSINERTIYGATANVNCMREFTPPRILAVLSIAPPIAVRVSLFEEGVFDDKRGKDNGNHGHKLDKYV